jgi:hypothetical protein
MSNRVYPDWIKAFVNTYDFIEPTEKLLFWSAVSAIASAVQHNVIVDQTSYKLPLNHYIIFVGDAGIRKSSAILQMRDVVATIAKTVGVKFTSQSSSWQAMVDELAENSKLEIIYNPKGSLDHTYVTAILSEFGVMFKADDAGMVDFLVDLWDLHTSWAKKARKDGKTIELHRPGINLLGGTTPTWIADNFRRSLAKGGLGSRIIWVHETRIKRLVTFVDEATPPDYQERLSNLSRDLLQIAAIKGTITFSAGAREIMRKWYTSAHAALLERGEDNVEAGFTSRKQAHAFKLGAILSLSRGASLEINEEDMHQATKIIDSVLPDINIIFKGFDVTKFGEHVAIVEDRIESSGISAPEAQILSRLGRRIATKKQFDEAMDTLVSQGLILIEGAAPYRKITHVRNLTPRQWEMAKYTNCKYHFNGVVN